MPIWIVHEIDEECGKGEPNYLFIFKFWSLCAHTADEVEKFIKITAMENPSLRNISNSILENPLQVLVGKDIVFEIGDFWDEDILGFQSILALLFIVILESLCGEAVGSSIFEGKFGSL